MNLQMYWIENKKIFFFCILLIVCFVGAGNYLPATQLLNFVSVTIAAFIILTGSIESDFYLLIALTPFYKALIIGNYGVGFIFPILGLLKLFFARRVKFNIGILLLIDVVIIFVLHDYDETSIGKILGLVPFLMYAGFYCYLIDLKKYDYKFALLVLLSSIIVVQVSIFIVQGGNIDVFYEDVGTRLGSGNADSDQRNLLGGAMGFPIYSMIVISSIVVFLKNVKINIGLKIALFSILLLEFFITFFTISKVYLLGLFCFVVILSFYFIFGSSLSKFFKFILSAFVFVISFLFFFENHIEHFISTYEYRTIYAIDASSGRNEIYKSVIDYLSEHPVAFLLGEGRWGYQNIGEQNNLPFLMTAHNIVLDGIMIYGLFGLIVIVMAYSNLLRRAPYKHIDLLNASPFICWFMMNMTASSFIVEKNYIIVMPLLINIYACEQEKKGRYEVIDNYSSL